jgi:surfactin synthase thioesterase subunit
MLDKRWFLPIRYSPYHSHQLICFPCGGRNGSSFWSWQNLRANVNIWALRLPGKENHFIKEMLISAQELMPYILDALNSTLELPYIFYGHSMGAGLAFQTMVELQKNNKPLPLLLMASGRQPPHYPYEVKVSHLSDEKFIEYLKQLGSLSEDLAKNTAFLDYYLPKIRKDYELNNSIPCQPPNPLAVPIVIINGEEDPLINFTHLEEWDQHTLYPLRSFIVSGGHFFMDNNPEFMRLITHSIRIFCTN